MMDRGEAVWIVDTIQQLRAENARLREAAGDARLALDLALLADGLNSEIKNRLRTAWLKVDDVLRTPVQKAPCPGCDGYECGNGCAYPGVAEFVQKLEREERLRDERDEELARLQHLNIELRREIGRRQRRVSELEQALSQAGSK